MTDHLFKKEGDFVNHSSHLTQQQLDIKNCKLPFIAVKAYAGSGKTTVLFEYATANQNLNGIYLAFNKNIATEAAQKFPSNVTCKTIHSLAYANVGFKFESKISNKELRIKDIAQVIQNNDFSMCENILRIYKEFIASAYLDFSSFLKPIKKKDISLINKTIQTNFKNKDELFTHVAEIYSKLKVAIINFKSTNKIISKESDNDYDLLFEIVEKIKFNTEVKYAEILWKKSCDLNDNFPITHDGYLKLYQLSQPIILDKKNNKQYDFILYDEVQDSNECTLDIILKQNTTKVFVGDPYQQIYQFRGAINAFDKIKDKTNAILPLSKSWRFGNNIAHLASIFLACAYKENIQLEGISTNTKILVNPPSTPYTSNTLYLYRTNAKIVADCIKDIRLNPKSTFYFIGNVESYMISQILDYYYLFSNQLDKIQDLSVKRYLSWIDFSADVEINKDVAGTAIIKVVEEFTHQLEVYVPKIKEHIVKYPNQANKIISTAHKAKGREFDNVIMADDFLDLNMLRNIEVNISATHNKIYHQNILSEINLIYVAVTRAKKILHIPKNMYTFLLSVLQFSQSNNNLDCYIHDDQFFSFIQKNSIDPSHMKNIFFTQVNSQLQSFIKNEIHVQI